MTTHKDVPKPGEWSQLRGGRMLMFVWPFPWLYLLIRFDGFNPFSIYAVAAFVGQVVGFIMIATFKCPSCSRPFFAVRDFVLNSFSATFRTSCPHCKHN